jgi:RNA polymerase sigma-70 factor (ECF subfamily)
MLPYRMTTHTEQVQQLFIRHTGLLHGFIASLCGDLVLAEDILQEVFLVVTQKADSFVIGSDFCAWARAIARLKTMEHLRVRQRDRRMLNADALAALESSSPTLDDWHQQREAMHRCLELLSPGQRQLAQMAYGEGLSPQQIAERKTQGAHVVYVMLSKMRRALRECVMRRMGVET